MLFVSAVALLQLVAFTYGTYWHWKHQDDWYVRCRTVDEWRAYFKDNVASSWIFSDGVGH